MRVVRDLAAAKPYPSCVTFGVFDGVHLGHQALLRRTVEIARRGNLRSVALTFEPVPEAALHPNSQVAILTPADEKRALIRGLGLQLLVVAPFDAAFARMSPTDFLRNVLVARLGARTLVAGPRTRFGWRGQGTLALMEKHGPSLGFQVERVPEARVDGAVVSSTAIRLALARGSISAANHMLGRPYALSGRVVRGTGRGRSLGFPTFNLSLPPEKALPAYGVYAGFALVRGQRLAAAVYIGERPTFESHALAAEAHILSLPVPLRVRVIALQLLHRLRGDRAFSSPGLLTRQMRLDCIRARRLLRV